jgi:hypothetical protein
LPPLVKVVPGPLRRLTVLVTDAVSATADCAANAAKRNIAVEAAIGTRFIIVSPALHK